MVDEPMRRKVFISHYKGDRKAVDAFIKKWTDEQRVFIAKALGTFDNEDFINSTNTDYVMSQIRKKYIGDSTVTIVLIGECTHSRRYVDWEIKASLRQGEDAKPNGLLGILVNADAERAHLPERFKANWDSDNSKYARYHRTPQSASELRSWIEDAFAARTKRANLIQNSQEMWGNNHECKVHGVTH